MFKEKMGARSVRLAFGLAAGLAMTQSFAQEAPVQRVEVTGSAIKRINVEGALPIQTLSQEAIAKTGATSVAELIQTLPAMQGFTIGAIAAGTNSGGRVSASIHDIGESYTLVLLNGRRLAPQGSGSSVNLQAIPMSAVERVEILTDGASALYGSDAIAGVINFVLKKNQQGAGATWTPTAGTCWPATAATSRTRSSRPTATSPTPPTAPSRAAASTTSTTTPAPRRPRPTSPWPSATRPA